MRKTTQVRNTVYGENVCLPPWLVCEWKQLFSPGFSTESSALFPELSSDECDAFLLILKIVQTELTCGCSNPVLSRSDFLRNFSATRQSQRKSGSRLFSFLNSFGLRQGSSVQPLFPGRFEFEPNGDCLLHLDPAESMQDDLLGCTDLMRLASDRFFKDAPTLQQSKTSSGPAWFLNRKLWGDLSSKERIVFCALQEYLQSSEYYVQWDGTQVAPVNQLFDASGLTSREFLKCVRLISRKMQDHGHVQASVELEFPHHLDVEGSVGLFARLQSEHSRPNVEAKHKKELAGYFFARRKMWLQDKKMQKTLQFFSRVYDHPNLEQVYSEGFEKLGRMGLIEASSSSLALCHPLDLAVELLAKNAKQKNVSFAGEYELGSTSSVCEFTELLAQLYARDKSRLHDLLPEDLLLATEWSPAAIQLVREKGRPHSVNLPQQEKQQETQSAKSATRSNVREPVVEQNKSAQARAGASAAYPQTAGSPPEHSVMIAKARTELGGLRRNDYRHYERVRQAYLDSLDTSTLGIVKEMQSRLPRDLFDDQLGDRISQFMLDNPHLWKTVVKTAGYSQ